MKKVISLLLSLAMVLSLVACGSASNEKNNSGNTANDTVTDAESNVNSSVDKEADKEETQSQKPEVEVEEEQQEEAPAVDVIAASHTDVTFKASGNSFQLTASNVPENCTITYASEDETIATVDQEGVVTAVAPGTTNVTMCIEQKGVATYTFPCIVRCNWQEGGSAAGGMDLNAFFNNYMAGLGADNTPAMAELNAELIDAYYTGLNEIPRKQSVLQMAAMMQVAFEFALVECENAADVEAVKTIFQNRVDSQVNGGAWYPAVTAAWEDADIIVNGNIVALIVAGDQQSAAVAAFKNACSGK